MDRPGACLLGGEEEGAHLHGVSPRFQQPSRIRAEGDAARRDDRQLRMGRRQRRQRLLQQLRQRVVPGAVSCASVKRCLPASGPCRTRASGPKAAASTASSGEDTDSSTVVPASCSARIVAAGGRPKVKLTTGTGSSTSRAIF